jgi:hypothetical protein
VEDMAYFVVNRGAESVLIGNIPSKEALIVVRKEGRKLKEGWKEVYI